MFLGIILMKKSTVELLKRYTVATLGLILIALGVALSLKSNLGTAPISCPPAMFNLRWTGISVGTFTWLMHLVFILLQMVLLGRKFKPAYLMQLPAALVFGYLCDAAIWACSGITVTTYPGRLLLCLATVVVTAVGLRLEIIASAWMIAGDMTILVLSRVSRLRVSTVKILFDVACVLIAAVFAYACFGRLDGDGTNSVVREGTLILALLTGPCMRLTDPLVDRLFPRLAQAHGQ